MDVFHSAYKTLDLNGANPIAPRISIRTRPTDGNICGPLLSLPYFPHEFRNSPHPIGDYIVNSIFCHDSSHSQRQRSPRPTPWSDHKSFYCRGASLGSQFSSASHTIPKLTRADDSCSLIVAEYEQIFVAGDQECCLVRFREAKKV